MACTKPKPTDRFTFYEDSKKVDPQTKIGTYIDKDAYKEEIERLEKLQKEQEKVETLLVPRFDGSGAVNDSQLCWPEIADCCLLSHRC